MVDELLGHFGFAKLYLEEIDSPHFTRLAFLTSITIADVARRELHTTLLRSEAEKAISSGTAEALYRQFAVELE